jgi:hypothetical protein
MYLMSKGVVLRGRCGQRRWRPAAVWAIQTNTRILAADSLQLQSALAVIHKPAAEVLEGHRS